MNYRIHIAKCPYRLGAHIFRSSYDRVLKCSHLSKSLNQDLMVLVLSKSSVSIPVRPEPKMRLETISVKLYNHFNFENKGLIESKSKKNVFLFSK